MAYYDTTKDTAVVTDWSREGLGFVILQKYCECTLEDLPLYCDSGWKLVFCNSRHLTEAEKNYAPIEGEALAVTWALKKARMFLLGCHKFHIVVDHQPSVKIFGNKCMNDIYNHRLQKFKERTLRYSFAMKYIKGIRNHANVFSRYPANEPSKNDISESEVLEVSCIKQLSAFTNSTLSVTIDHIQDIVN